MKNEFSYPVTLTAQEEGGYLVRFPDLPEAITQGESVEDSLREAVDCLQEAIVNRLGNKLNIPEPSPIKENQYIVTLSAIFTAKIALYIAMNENKISKTALAKKLQCDEKEVRRLLDPYCNSKFSRIEKALNALGKKIEVNFVPKKIIALDKNEPKAEGVDELHIPHINLLHWVSTSEKKNVSKAMKDKNKRPYGITFFIEDLRANTSYAHVRIEEDELSQSLKVDSNSINSWFNKNKEGYLESILVGVDSTNQIDAFKIAYSHISTVLSLFTFFYRRPFRIWQTHVFDKKNKVTFITPRFKPKPEKLKLPNISFLTNNPLGSLFSLYREGMNSLDLPYRFTNFFKIYEAWFFEDSAKKFFYRDEKPRLPIIITKKMLSGTYRKKYHQEFLDKDILDKELYLYLNTVRKYLSHPFIDRYVPPSFYNLDEVSVSEALECMSNLIERIATKILDDELSLLSSINPKINDLVKIYKQGK